MQADRQASLRPVLAVDTCGKRLGVALVAGDATFASEPADSAARADHVGEVASALLASAGLRVEDLAALAVTIGPGSYTGVRIGLALVRGLSLVDQTPVVALGSLELLSLATPSAAGRICALLDASRDSVYAAVYDRAGDALSEVMAPRIVERYAVTDVLREHASGGLAARCESEGALELDASVSQVLVPASRARRLAEIARARVAEGRVATADSVMPLYIGTSSARPNTNKVVVSSRAGE